MTIDGVAMFGGWVTFRPGHDANLRRAQIFYNDKSRKIGKPGRYFIEQKFGPAPGRYRVEVRHVSKDFIVVPSMDAARLYTRLASNVAAGVPACLPRRRQPGRQGRLPLRKTATEKAEPLQSTTQFFRPSSCPIAHS